MKLQMIEMDLKESHMLKDIPSIAHDNSFAKTSSLEYKNIHLKNMEN